MEGAETKFLIAVLCEYVTNNYLEPKYAPATPLDEQALSEMSLHDMIWAQEEFKRQLLQKTAAAEEAQTTSTVEVAATGMKQENGQADKEGSDIEMDDLEKSLEDAHDDVSRASISKRLVKWRVTKLYSMPQPARSVGHSPSQDSASHDFALKVLQEMLTADRGAYKRLRRFMERLKKTEEGRWYCVRAIGIDPGSFRDAERLPITALTRKTKCDTCVGTCLQLQSSGGRKGQKKLFYATPDVCWSF